MQTLIRFQSPRDQPWREFNKAESNKKMLSDWIQIEIEVFWALFCMEIEAKKYQFYKLLWKRESETWKRTADLSFAANCEEKNRPKLDKFFRLLLRKANKIGDLTLAGC